MIITNKLIFSHILEKLKESKYDFILSGSRAWGTEKVNSDYDFFVQDSTEVRLWLEEIGFIKYKAGSSYDTDGQCVCVYLYEKENHPSVHVQCVADVKIKTEIQNILLKCYTNGFANKETATVVWKTAFSVYEALMTKESPLDGFK